MNRKGVVLFPLLLAALAVGTLAVSLLSPGPGSVHNARVMYVAF